MKCPFCAFENPPGFRFCGQCGAYFPPDSPSDQPNDSAERRQLTVMFCDLVGSTELSERLDPEELREVVREYQALCASIVRRHEGIIAQYLGDGILVYFGYPLAHEDDARRAVRTAIRILKALNDLNASLQVTKEITLQVRIGIHTGLVVVGEIGTGEKREHLALGETPNIAARLQALADRNTILISSATHRLIQRHFECELAGSYTLRGVSHPIVVYRVAKEGRMEQSAGEELPSLLNNVVGREDELKTLMRYWEEAKSGLEHIIMIEGEPGIGKSRLIQTFRANIAEESYRWLEMRCSPYHQASPLYPIIEFMQRQLKFKREDPVQAKLEQLEQMLQRYGVDVASVAPFFAEFLNLPSDGRYPQKEVSPKRKKHALLDAFITILQGMAAKQPIIFVVEDLHWIDPSTLELLESFVKIRLKSPIYKLYTFRPSFRPPWTERRFPHIVLGKLNNAHVQKLILRLTGGKKLPAEVLRQIEIKTDGVPLFVEELTKMVLESGLVREKEREYELTGPLPPLAIPSTLHDSLMARLDKLSTIKSIAQLGATIGREFNYELLEAVANIDETTLSHALQQLVDAELLKQEGEIPKATFTFKHALIQDASYQSLLKSVRQKYHQQIAQTLLSRFPETAIAQPELLAHHYVEAGLKEPSIFHLQQAGQRALGRSANIEAIGHVKKGLELVQTLNPSPSTRQLELDLLITLGSALISTKGYASPEVEQTFARARKICEEMGDSPAIFQVLMGTALFYLVRGDFSTAESIATQIKSIKESCGTDSPWLMPDLLLGISLFYRGDLVKARESMIQALGQYDRKLHQSMINSFGGGDPGVATLSHIAWIEFLMGNFEEARKGAEAAILIAGEMGHPYSINFALMFAANLYQAMQDITTAEQYIGLAMSVSVEQEFTLFTAIGKIIHGWTLVQRKKVQKGIDEIVNGIELYQSTGSATSMPYYLSLLAEGYRDAGQFDLGMRTLDDALTMINKTGDRYWEAEIYRQKGEMYLLIDTSCHKEAQRCFDAALVTARKQHATTLELRAATSLSRLLLEQENSAEARNVISEVYRKFTGKPDNADLRIAKELINVLG